MLKKLISGFLFLALAGGGYYYYTLHKDTVDEYISQYVDSKSFATLEVRYSANSIMENNKETLLKDEFHKYSTPELHFYPYMLMEVKYSKNNNTTSEGVILWDLDDAEFVISTTTWQKTHGFEDCITARVDHNDFKVINALAFNGGQLSRKDLSDRIRIENEVLDRWLESCRKKKIVVQSGNGFRLHLEKPRIAIRPETTLDHHLVTQTIKNVKQRPRRYTMRQVEKVAYLAFGADFTIKKSTEIYLPVYKIDVKNPDGSLLTTYWNALTGLQISNLHAIL
ncbi:MAG: hypothetical protein S4CHLAM6_12650 [Chlamydiae bacterium]|nr:hypothetical protein [Chlamydiota bacterium]